MQCAVVAPASFVIAMAPAPAARTLLPRMPRLLNVYEEGIIFTDAMRVLDGPVVHRDFYSPYGPLQVL